MCLCGCEKGQTLFEKIQSHVHVHSSGWSISGHTHGHNHSVEASFDPQGAIEALCREVEDEHILIKEELLKMKGHMRQLVNYLMKDGLIGKQANLKEFINEEAKDLLVEARDEIKKLRAEAGFLSESDMKLK